MPTFKKTMEPIDVAIEEGHIHIRQAYPGEQDTSVVILHPEQIDLLIKWLKQAQTLLLQDQR